MHPSLTCLESGLGGVGRSLSRSLTLQGTRAGKQKGAGEGGRSQGSVKKVPCVSDYRKTGHLCPETRMSHRVGYKKGLAPSPKIPDRFPHSTLLEEPAKVRSQVDCLSFSEDAGDCEEVSSALGLMEAGGSETCDQHKRPCWDPWAQAGSSLLTSSMVASSPWTQNIWSHEHSAPLALCGKVSLLPL